MAGKDRSRFPQLNSRIARLQSRVIGIDKLTPAREARSLQFATKSVSFHKSATTRRFLVPTPKAKSGTHSPGIRKNDEGRLVYPTDAGSLFLPKSTCVQAEESYFGVSKIMKDLRLDTTAEVDRRLRALVETFFPSEAKALNLHATLGFEVQKVKQVSNRLYSASRMSAGWLKRDAQKYGPLFVSRSPTIRQQRVYSTLHTPVNPCLLKHN